MQWHDNREQELAAALGKPKYYIETEGKTPGEQYFWFPTHGDSMTDNTARSIPSGSLVLGRLLQIKCIQDIPLDQPIVIIIDDNGQQFCMLKSACKVLANELCLRSYNPAKRYDDFRIPFDCVKFIFVVERVRLPDGGEFILQSDRHK
jgi:hypothetical protein